MSGGSSSSQLVLAPHLTDATVPCGWTGCAHEFRANGPMPVRDQLRASDWMLISETIKGFRALCPPHGRARRAILHDGSRGAAVGLIHVGGHGRWSTPIGE